ARAQHLSRQALRTGAVLDELDAGQGQTLAEAGEVLPQQEDAGRPEPQRLWSVLDHRREPVFQPAFDQAAGDIHHLAQPLAGAARWTAPLHIYSYVYAASLEHAEMS